MKELSGQINKNGKDSCRIILKVDEKDKIGIGKRKNRQTSLELEQEKLGEKPGLERLLKPKPKGSIFNSHSQLLTKANCNKLKMITPKQANEILAQTALHFEKLTEDYRSLLKFPDVFNIF